MINASPQPFTIPEPELDSWIQVLQKVAAEPLQFSPHFPTIARRYEAWWAQNVVDRPLFLAASNPYPNRPITRRLELLSQPEAWHEAKYADMQQLHRVGDALPWIRVDFGPVFLSGLLGGRVEHGSDTTWTHAFIDDSWSNVPDGSIQEDSLWWKLLLELLVRVAQDAPGRYLVCTPDLGGSGDVLLNLRGSEKLCLDMVEQPERVRLAVDAIYPAWLRAFRALYRCTTEWGAGLVHWLGLWSSRPYMIPACDFSALVGPAHFQSIFLPEIAHQAATVGRAVFHLDGPDAARHIDALLDVPVFQAIQFTPGAGTPSALAWVEMLRKIQRRGRSLLVICPAEEVMSLCEALQPEGLAILVENPPAPAQLDDLYAQFCQYYGCAAVEG
jgi:hypothetical protein